MNALENIQPALQRWNLRHKSVWIWVGSCWLQGHQGHDYFCLSRGAKQILAPHWCLFDLAVELYEFTSVFRCLKKLICSKVERVQWAQPEAEAVIAWLPTQCWYACHALSSPLRTLSCWMMSAWKASALSCKLCITNLPPHFQLSGFLHGLENVLFYHFPLSELGIF